MLLVFLSSRRALSLPGPWLSSGVVVITTSIATIAWTAGELPLWIGIGCVGIAGAALIADSTLRDIVKQVLDRSRSSVSAADEGPQGPA